MLLSLIFRYLTFRNKFLINFLHSRDIKKDIFWEICSFLLPTPTKHARMHHYIRSRYYQYIRRSNRSNRSFFRNWTDKRCNCLWRIFAVSVRLRKSCCKTNSEITAHRKVAWCAAKQRKLNACRVPSLGGRFRIILNAPLENRLAL